MVYTEIQKRNNKKYFYRVISIRTKDKISKKRKYLGVNLSPKDLIKKEREADRKLRIKNVDKNKITIEKIKPQIIKILKKNKIKRAGIFGSYARGEQKKSSDIDLLVEYPKGMGLEFVSIKFELEDKLGKKIDLVTYKGIHPLLKKRILNEEIRII